MARGKPSKSPGNGKKIATFPFDVEQEADGKVISRKIEIAAYMQSKYTGDTAPFAVSSVNFMLECEGEKIHCSDLDSGLKEMRSKLDKRYRIQWERWLLVKVMPVRIHDGIGAGTELRWSEVYRGVTLDGDVLMREYNRYGDWSNQWRVSPWPEVYKDGRTGKTIACVPATDDNEKALEAFADKLRELTKTLSEFVAPDRIEETLAMIASGQIKLLGSG